MASNSYYVKHAWDYKHAFFTEENWCGRRAIHVLIKTAVSEQRTLKGAI